MGEILIGTCGYGRYDPGEGWKDRYVSKLQAFSHDFPAVELNRTFYKLPMVKTAEKWRRNARDDFEFTVKAWQALTHTIRSPTWRGKKDGLSDEQKENFGYLRPNQEVVDAWEETKERVKALDADVCLIQTPGSFDCTEENEENIRELFSMIDRGDINIAWEPRGDWKDKEGRVKEICDDLALIHVTDLMRREPVSEHDISYVRLHGLNEKEYDYDYDYSEDELQELVERLRVLKRDHEKVFCMFNNYEMYENAGRLLELLEEEGLV